MNVKGVQLLGLMHSEARLIGISLSNLDTVHRRPPDMSTDVHLDHVIGHGQTSTGVHLTAIRLAVQQQSDSVQAKRHSVFSKEA